MRAERVNQNNKAASRKPEQRVEKMLVKFKGPTERSVCPSPQVKAFHTQVVIWSVVDIEIVFIA